MRVVFVHEQRLILSVVMHGLRTYHHSALLISFYQTFNPRYSIFFGQKFSHYSQSVQWRDLDKTWKTAEKVELLHQQLHDGIFTIQNPCFATAGPDAPVNKYAAR